MTSLPAPAPVSHSDLLHAARQDIDATDAVWLLMHVAGVSRTWLFTHGDAPAAPSLAKRYRGLVARRAAGEPVAYLTGRRGFWRFELEVTPATLIPRAETERLVELALERLPADRPLELADLGTGSGAIALALATERPAARVAATDASAEALAVARRNAASLGLSNVEFHAGDWCAALPARAYDLIASNPPYIADRDPHLEEGDLRFEPATALASGPDGLAAIRQIAREATAHLAPGGWLLVEHGWEQGAPVRAIFEGAGYVEVDTAVDLEQRDRVTLGRRT